MTKDDVYALNDMLAAFCADRKIDVSDDRLNEAVWACVAALENEEE